MGWRTGRAPLKTASKCTQESGGTTKDMGTGRKSTRPSVTGIRDSLCTTNTRDKACLRMRSTHTMAASTREYSTEKDSSGTSRDKHLQASSGKAKKWQAGSRCPTAAHTRGSSRATCRTGGESSGGRTECATWGSGEEGHRRGRAWSCGKGGR